MLSLIYNPFPQHQEFEQSDHFSAKRFSDNKERVPFHLADATQALALVAGLTSVPVLQPEVGTALRAVDVISNHALEAGWIKGGCRLPQGAAKVGRRAPAAKAGLCLGFPFHFVKEKGYTPGTTLNKGHSPGAALSSLFFIWVGMKADRVIQPDPAFLPVRSQTPGTVSQLLFPATTLEHALGAVHEEAILFQVCRLFS